MYIWHAVGPNNGLATYEKFIYIYINSELNNNSWDHHFSDISVGFKKHSCGTAGTGNGLEFVLAAGWGGFGDTENTFTNTKDLLGSDWLDQGPPPHPVSHIL